MTPATAVPGPRRRHYATSNPRNASRQRMRINQAKNHGNQQLAAVIKSNKYD